MMIRSQALLMTQKKKLLSNLLNPSRGWHKSQQLCRHPFVIRDLRDCNTHTENIVEWNLKKKIYPSLHGLCWVYIEKKITFVSSERPRTIFFYDKILKVDDFLFRASDLNLAENKLLRNWRKKRQLHTLFKFKFKKLAKLETG